MPFKAGDFFFFLNMNHGYDITYNKRSACQHVISCMWMYSSFTGSSNMVTGETKSFFSFAKSVSVPVQ